MPASSTAKKGEGQEGKDDRASKGKADGDEEEDEKAKAIKPVKLKLKTGDKEEEFDPVEDQEALQAKYDKLASEAGQGAAVKTAIAKAFKDGDPEALRQIYKLIPGISDEQVEQAVSKFALNKETRKPVRTTKPTAEEDDDETDDEDVSTGGSDDSDLSVRQLLNKKDEGDEVGDAPITVRDLETVVAKILTSSGRKGSISLNDLDAPSQRLISKMLTAAETSRETAIEGNAHRVDRVLKSDKRLGALLDGNTLSEEQRTLLYEAANNAIRNRLDRGENLKPQDLEGARQAARNFAKRAWPHLYGDKAQTGGKGAGATGADAEDYSDVDRTKPIDARNRSNESDLSRYLRAVSAEIDAEEKVRKRG